VVGLVSKFKRGGQTDDRDTCDAGDAFPKSILREESLKNFCATPSHPPQASRPCDLVPAGLDLSTDFEEGEI